MLIEHLNRQLREREGQGLLRQRRSAESPCAPLQRVAHPGQPARDVLGFCSNDYLGLANHPALIEALADGALRYGAGSGASHLINGHSHAHAALEDDLAAWLAPCIPGRRRCSSAPATWPTWPCSPRSATPRQRSSPTSSTTLR